MRTCIFQEEIVMDILSRLPAKSLARFRCVSKPWNALMSEPYFKKMHLNRTKNLITSQKLLFTKYVDGSFDLYSCSLTSDVELVNDISRFGLPLSCEVDWGYVRTDSSCDGLLLTAIDCKNEGLYVIKLLLWNPTIGESILLPDPEFQVNECFFGLGYDPNGDDYKVLAINIYDDIRPHQILSLRGGSWRTIDDGNVSEASIEKRYCLSFVHGAFHWVERPEQGGCCVVSFNISNERYGEVPVPNIDCDISLEVEVVVSVLGGMLCVYHDNRVTFGLWVMKDYGVKESWTRLLTIPYIGVYCRITPLCRFPNDEVLLRSETDSRGDVLNTYDIGSSAFTNRIWSLESDDIQAYASCVYTESLISPKLGH